MPPKSNQTTPNKQPPPPPEDWNQLLTEFIQKGGRQLQKTFIKKLWAVHEELLENANPSTLRMMFFSPAVAVCPEGVKLMAIILFKIGIENGLRLLEKLIVQYDISDGECQRYGEVFKTAWKNAFQEANFDLTEELETSVISVFIQNAIFGHKPACSKFRKVLAAFAAEKKVDKDLDTMVTSLLNGCLFTALGSRNHIVQSSAAEVLFQFYPLIGEDAEDMTKCMENQHMYMSDLLHSDIISIRADAVKSVLKALAEYWLIIPKHQIKDLMGFIIDTLSRDTVVAVRAATFEGLNEMAFVPACLTVFEHALKCVATRGMQDKSERVRLVAFQLLARLKNHKFISVFDVIERDDAIAKLDIETVESCRRQLIPIMHILLPISSKNLDESYYRPRINYILGKSRLALLSYFRLLGPMKIIEASQAAKLIEMLITWAYRYLRKKDGPPLPETSEGYKKARAYLECALILYMSCKGMFLIDGNDGMKGKCDNYFGKVVKEIFEKYVNTPILGTATAISSVIPKDNLKPIANDVLNRLADDDVPSEAVEPFLESALHFNPDSIFDSFDNGFNVLVELFGPPQKSKTKKRDIGQPEEILTTTLNRLKYLMQSHSTANLVAMRDAYRTKIIELLTKVDLVRDAIEVRLVRPEGEKHVLNDETLLTTLEFRFILPLFAAVNGCDEDEERKNFIESTKQLLTWFDENIAQKMPTFEEHNQDFLVDLTRTFLDCVNIALSAYDFTTRPMEYEDEADRPEEPENTETVAQIVTKVVLSFCNSSTPVELFSPLLRLAATLCEESYSECHSEMANVLQFVPKWINKQCQEAEEDERFFEKDKEPLDALRTFYKRVCDTDYWDDASAEKLAKTFVVFSLVALTDESDEEEFEDPRHEEYVAPQFVSFTIQKFMGKEKTLTEDILKQIDEKFLVGDKYLSASEPVNSLLIRLSGLAQFLRILEKSSKFCGAKIQESLEACAKKVLDYFAKENLEGVEQRVMNSLTALLDVDLPDGF